jgi:tetratricopeptide (TPR) repeat protein
MKKILMGVMGLLLGVGAVGGQELSEADKKAIAEAAPYMERGNEFVEKGTLPRAKAEYTRALKVFPRHLDAIYNLAVVCEKLNEFDEAVRLYRQYLELRPNDADVWTQLGVRLDDSDKKTEAEAAYRKALEANKDFGRAHHNLGVLLKEKGDLEAAQKHLETYVKLEQAAGNPAGDGCYSLGALFLAQGKVREAKLLMQKATEADPAVAYYQNGLGDAYLAEKSYELAAAAYNKALEKDPKYAPAYSGLGDANRLQGAKEKALACYRKALELRKDYHLVHYKLGLVLAEGSPAEARKQFELYLASGKKLQFEKEATDQLNKLKDK